MGSLTYPVVYNTVTILRATSGGTVFSGNLAGDATMDYFEDSAVVDDCLYFEFGDCNSGVSKGLRFNVGTQLVAAAITVAWEYYSLDGNWTPFPNLVDGTNAFQNAGVNDVTWDMPDWPYYLYINGQREAWIRVRITAVTAITEGGAQQTDKCFGIYPCIVIDGQNGGNPWTMTDILAADVAGGWNVVKELAHGFPTDLEFHDWPRNRQANDPWPNRERTWLVNASFLFDDESEEHHSEFKKETILCHGFTSSLGGYSGSRATFGEYDAASDTTRRGCIVIMMGYGFWNWSALGRRISLRAIQLYSSVLDVRGRSRPSFIVDYLKDHDAVDTLFIHTTQNTMYDASCVFRRCSWISDWGSGPLVIASPTFIDCNFCASNGMAAAFYTYRNRYPVTITGGSVRNYAGRYAFYMQRFGYFDTSAVFNVRDVSWSEVGTDVYWLVTMPTMPAYGYISNQKSLTLKVVDEYGADVVGASVKVWDVDDTLVVDETTDGVGEIPLQYLVQDEWRKTAPEGSSGNDTTMTSKTPHTIEILKSGHRTLRFAFTLTGTLKMTLGLIASGGGPPGGTVGFPATPISVESSDDIGEVSVTSPEKVTIRTPGSVQVEVSGEADVIA